MNNAGSRSFGCLFILSLPLALVSALVCATLNASRAWWLVTALAGATACLSVVGYLISKLIALTRAGVRPAAAPGHVTPPPVWPGVCALCRLQPANCICVTHSVMLCASCSHKHHQIGTCFYTNFMRMPEPPAKGA